MTEVGTPTAHLAKIDNMIVPQCAGCSGFPELPLRLAEQPERLDCQAFVW